MAKTEKCGVKGCNDHKDCKMCRNLYLKELPHDCTACMKGGECGFVAREETA